MRRRALALILALLLAAGIACSPPPPAAKTALPSAAGSPSPPNGILRFAAVGDVGQGNEGERAIAAAIAREHEDRPIELLLLLGDLIYPSGRPGEYRARFERPFASVVEAGIELKAVLGNHDVRTDPRQVMRLFGMPSRFYAFSRGPVAFFALDSSGGSLGTTQVSWLEEALGNARARWKVLFTHIPPYSSGLHGGAAALRSEIAPLAKRHRVALVLTGHDHDYERTRPIDGTTYVVSGGGCCPRAVGRSEFTARAERALHFVVVEATERTLTLRAIGADGREIDRVAMG